MSVRISIFGIAIALLGAGCTAPSVFDPDSAPSSISVEPSASPFTHVTAGQVRAMVPDGWDAVPASKEGDPRAGFLASPKPEAWRRMDGATAGMSVTWVDATRVGVPSDFYYMAATGPVLSRLTHSDTCRPESQRVLLNNRPSFGIGSVRDGDYMARGEGTCRVDGTSTRWAYFVAAPGFGPVRHVGIPSSGLYVVVAVMRESESAKSTLHRLIKHTSFGGASVNDFVEIAGTFRAD